MITRPAPRIGNELKEFKMMLGEAHTRNKIKEEGGGGYKVCILHKIYQRLDSSFY